MGKKILTWAVVGFAAYYIYKAPHSAAGLVTGGLNGLKSAAGSLAEFLSSLRL
jgi:hypothetical protein